jgi:hypothetical protein
MFWSAIPILLFIAGATRADNSPYTCKYLISHKMSLAVVLAIFYKTSQKNIIDSFCKT